MKKIIFGICGVYAFAFANIGVKSLDIYRNNTFVTQNLNLQEKSVPLVENVRFEDIRFLVNGSCTIKDKKLIVNKFSNDELSLKLEDLEKKVKLKFNEFKALEKSIKFLENLSLKDSSQNFDNIKNISDYINTKLKENYDKKYFLEKETTKLKEEVFKFKNQKINQISSKLDYDISCKDGGKVAITYPIYSVRNNSFYEINANSEKNTIEIKNLAFISQSSGYDFKNIDINLYTFNFSNNLEPIDFKAQYLDIYPKNTFFGSKKFQSDVMMEEEVKRVSKRSFKLKEAVPSPAMMYEQTQTKSFFKASNITLKKGVNTQVLFANDTYKTKNSIAIDGFGYEKPFYKVQFKSDKLYGLQNAKLYLDGIFIAEHRQNEIKKSKQSDIFFGEDRLIDVKKDLVENMTEEPFLSMSKIKTKKLWKYKITNNHKVQKDISLIERLPVSKNDDIEVKLLSKPKYTKKEKNGKITYDFSLKPNETKIIEFGYEIEKPLDK